MTITELGECQFGYLKYNSDNWWDYEWVESDSIKTCYCEGLHRQLPGDATDCGLYPGMVDLPKPGEERNIYEEVCGAGALALASKGAESGTSSAGRLLTGFAAGASVVAATAAALIAVRKCRKGSDIYYQRNEPLI